MTLLSRLSRLTVVLLATGVIFPLFPAAAEESAADSAGISRLQAYLENLDAMQANFRQQVFDSNREIIEETRGQVLLKKPGRFRWHYTEPFERIIVADGTRVWLYEADLEQVTVRPLTAELGETPAALLTGESAALEQFDLVGSEQIDGIDWLHLVPKSVASDFRSVGLGFDGDNLVQIALDDQLGQRTRIYLSAIEYPADVSDDDFQFDIPDGVDVIGETDL